LSILKEGWQANQELIQVVYGLLQILETLNPEDIEKPLYAKAAELMNNDLNEFRSVV
jgi:ubiquitin-protein ligase